MNCWIQSQRLWLQANLIQLGDPMCLFYVQDYCESSSTTYIVGSNKKLEVFVCPIQGSTYLNNACLIIKCALTTKSKEAWMEVKRKQSSTRFRIHGQSQWNQYWYLCKWIRNNNTIHYAQCFRIKKRIVPLPVSSYHYFVRFSARNSVGLGGFFGIISAMSDIFYIISSFRKIKSNCF